MTLIFAPCSICSRTAPSINGWLCCRGCDKPACERCSETVLSDEFGDDVIVCHTCRPVEV